MDSKKNKDLVDIKSVRSDSTLCTINFKNNKSAILPKDMISRFGLLMAQESKSNIYDLHTVTIEDFMHLLNRIFTIEPSLAFEMRGKNLQLYDYLHTDPSSVRTINQCIDKVFKYIHKQLLDNYITEKAILDEFNAKNTKCYINFGYIYIRLNDDSKDVYNFEFGLSNHLWDEFCITRYEYEHHLGPIRESNPLFSGDIHVDADNLKYTIHYIERCVESYCNPDNQGINAYIKFTNNKEN